MQYFGICLDQAAVGAYPASFVAALVEQMPPDCRWRIAYEPDCWWTGDRLLLANLVNSLNGLIWGMSDKSKRGPEPKPIGPKNTGRSRGRELPAVVMSRAQLIDELSKPRKSR